MRLPARAMGLRASASPNSTGMSSFACIPSLMKQGTNISVAYDAATGAGEIREASRGRTTMVFFGVRGTEGEYDNNALLQAVKDAFRMV